MKQQTRKYLKKLINNKTRSNTKKRSHSNQKNKNKNKNKKTLKGNRKGSASNKPRHTKKQTGGFITLFKRKKLRNQLRKKINKCLKRSQDANYNCKEKITKIIGKFNYEFYDGKNTTTFSDAIMGLVKANKKVSNVEVNNVINDHIKEVRGLSGVGTGLLGLHILSS
jgi:hypothetical protein